MFNTEQSMIPDFSYISDYQIIMIYGIRFDISIHELETKIMKTSSGKRKYEALILAIGVLMAAVAIFNFSSGKNAESEFTSQIRSEVVPVETVTNVN